LFNVNLFAEGSKDLYPTNVSGNRSFLISRGKEGDAFNPFPTYGRTYVYVKAGETIHVGSSVLGLGTSSSYGKIVLYSPNGTKVEYGSYNSTLQGASANVEGRIRSRVEEIAGPKVSGISTTGYTPMSRTVASNEDGIWVVEFYAKQSDLNSSTTSLYITANAEWQANNFNTASSDNVVNSHSFITAWDVTVQSGSSFVSGRVYSTVFNFGMGNSASASKNGFFGKYYVLTRDGFTYEVDNNGHNGLSYNSFVNNTGTLVDNTDTQSYQSFSYPSSNVASTIKAKLHDPRVIDNSIHVTHKMFYNKPASDLPDSARIWVPDRVGLNSTDLFNWYTSTGATGKVWLHRNRDEDMQPKNLRLVGLEGTDGIYSGKGGYFIFKSDVEGKYNITIPSAAGNRTLTGTLYLGENKVFWDGKDGSGNDMISGTDLANVKIRLSAAEIHFPFLDVESNSNGIKIQALTSTGNYYTPTKDSVCWNLPIELTGTNPPPTYSNLNGLPTTGAKTSLSGTNKILWWGKDADGGSTGQFGDNKAIVVWTNREGNEVDKNFAVKKESTDLEVTGVTLLSGVTSISVGDNITYGVNIKNNGPSDATGTHSATFKFYIPAGITINSDNVTFTSLNGAVIVSATKTMQTVTDSQGKIFNVLTVKVDMPINSTGLFTIPASLTDGSLIANTVNSWGTIMRANDIEDPDAFNTNLNIPVPVDPFQEAKGILTVVSSLNLNNPTGITLSSTNNIKYNNSVSLLHKPNAVDDAVTTMPNVPVEINILTNDFLDNGSVPTAAGVTVKLYPPSGATVSGDYKTVTVPGEGIWTYNSTTGKLTFAPEVGFSGSPTQIKYTITYSGLESDQATVTITTIPIAKDDINQTQKDTPVSGNLLDNDKNLTILTSGLFNSTALTVDGTTTNTLSDGTTTYGTIVINPNGTYIFTPEAGYTGTVPPISYTAVNAGGGTDNAKLYITVTNKLQPEGTNNPPVANHDVGTVKQGGVVTVNILSNDSDPDGDALSVTVINYNGSAISTNSSSPTTIIEGGVTAGTAYLDASGKLVFTAAPTYTGDVPFTYTISDGKGGTASSTINVTVTSTATPLIIANDDAKSFAQGTSSVSGSVKDNDSWGGTNPRIIKGKVTYGGSTITLAVGTEITITGVGKITLNADGTYTFKPDADFVGTVPVTYTVINNEGVSDTATLYLTSLEKASEKSNFWHGTVSTDWATANNWTALKVPASGEDVEFATAANNNNNPAQRDLYLDADRIIGNLINNSNVDLVVTTGNQLTINGNVQDSNPSSGTIVVKSAMDKATGTLLFADPSANTSVNATVEFYNKAYECDNCGFYRKQWQYFGIPVQSSGFPYQTPSIETVNQWIEPYNGDKWRPAPYAPDEMLKAFKGYEITNSSNALPTNIYSFPGVLNVGNASVPVTKTLNINYSGMNLVANSFAAAIPITSEAIGLGSVELESNTAYLFNMGSRDQWRKLNGGGITGVAAGQYQAVPFNLSGQAGIPDRILSMHTFMLDVKTPGNVTLQYDKLTKNELNQSTTVAWKSVTPESSIIELPHIVMDVIGNESADRVWLFEHANATTGFDNGWDGYKIKEGDLIQTYVSGSDQSDYQIATLSDINGAIIGVKSEPDENFEINLSVTSDLEGRNLYLHDLVTGNNYPILNNAEYVIAGTNASSTNRFKVMASSSGSILKNTESSLINVDVRSNIVFVENQTKEDCVANIYDITGRLIINKQVPKNQIVKFTELSQGRAAIYIVRVISGNKSINKTDRVLLK